MPQLAPPPTTAPTHVEVRAALERDEQVLKTNVDLAHAALPRIVLPLSMREEVASPLTSAEVREALLQNIYTPRSNDPVVKRSVGLMYKMMRFDDLSLTLKERHEQRAEAIKQWEAEGKVRPWLRYDDGMESLGSGFRGNAYETTFYLAGARQSAAWKVKAGADLADPRAMPALDMFGRYSPRLDAMGYYEKVLSALETLALPIDPVTGAALLPHPVTAGHTPREIWVEDLAVAEAKRVLQRAVVPSDPAPGITGSTAFRARVARIVDDVSKLGAFAPIDAATGSRIWPLVRDGDRYTIEPRSTLDPASPVAGLEISYFVPATRASKEAEIDRVTFVHDGESWLRRSQIGAAKESPAERVPQLPGWDQVREESLARRAGKI